jgi:hypothetical protein
MFVQYKNYQYIDPNGDNSSPDKGSQEWKDCQFNQEKVNNLIANRCYLDAANYLSHYRRNDPNEQLQLDNTIRQLQQKAPYVEKLYHGATEEEKQAMDFLDAVFTDGGLEKVQENYKNNNKENTFISKFVEAKQKIMANTRRTPNAKLQITLPTREGKHWYNTDNDVAEQFWYLTEKSQNELAADGVEFSRNNEGETVLTFDQSNKSANKMLYALSSIENGWLTDYATVAMKNEDQTIIPANQPAMHHVKDIINDAKELLNNRKKTMGMSARQYVVDVGPELYNYKAEADNLKAQGLIDKTEYKFIVEQGDQEIANMLQNISLANAKEGVYSNIGRDDATEFDSDMTLRKITDQESLNQLDFYLHTLPAKSIKLAAGYVNGKIGTYLTIPGDLDDKQNVVRGEYQVFVPGLFYQEAQELMNADTQYRANYRMADMQAYGVDYISTDNRRLRNYGNKFQWEDDKSGKFLTTEEALYEINKDQLIFDGRQGIISRYQNAEGQMLDSNKDPYTNMAWNYACKAAEELNPGINVIDVDNNVYDSSALIKLFYDKNQMAANGYDCLFLAQRMKKENYRMVTDIFSIYDRLLNRYAQFFGQYPAIPSDL